MSMPTGVIGYNESDSEDELPSGWEERVAQDGRVYFVSHAERETQWTHPRTGKRKQVAGGLPENWVKIIADDERILFRNTVTGNETYTDPRLAFAVEHSAPDSVEPPADVTQLRQRFDASTRALAVLHGVELAGRTVLITGANTGIGYETARALAFHHAHVVMACRSVAKAEQAAGRIRKEKPGVNIDYLECDLASLRSVQRCARQFAVKKW